MRGSGGVCLPHDAATFDGHFHVDLAAEVVLGNAERFQHLELRQLGVDEFDRLRVDTHSALALANGRAGDGGLLLTGRVRYHVTLAPSFSETSPSEMNLMFESRSSEVSSSISPSSSYGLPT